jgi:hypothetical protein
LNQSKQLNLSTFHCVSRTLERFQDLMLNEK